MQVQLELIGGQHAGPLFAALKKRGAKCRIRGARRWHFTARRTPMWADRSLMRQLVTFKAVLSRCSGVQMSLDHIVPLIHPLVCGLHCPENIEVISMARNLAKSNKFWPDMPEIQLELL